MQAHFEGFTQVQPDCIQAPCWSDGFDNENGQFRQIAELNRCKFGG